METVVINDIINYDDQTGLNVSSRGEILEDLKNITKIAYGTDYVIEQGNEWYSFLDLLAGTLSNLGGVCQKLYSCLSFTGASGTNLDDIVSYVGITRRPETNSRVIVKATTDSNVSRPIAFQSGEIILEDSNGHTWTNIEELYISRYKADNQTENYIGTATFEATSENQDPTNIILTSYNNNTGSNLTVKNSIPAGITFINEVNSILGCQLETDAQLRARYRDEVFRDAVGSVEGLTAKIIENSNAAYCYILENNLSESSQGLPPHSIWVVTDGKSTWDGTGTYSTDPDDINIAQAILDYKSLGCGIGTITSAPTYNPSTGEGKISVQIARDNTEYDIVFNRASKVSVTLELNIASTLTAGSQRDSIELQIKQNIVNYINNLGISNDVLNSGVYASVYKVITDNKYSDYLLDINSIEFDNDPTKKRINITQYQYANIDESDITVNWVS